VKGDMRTCFKLWIHQETANVIAERRTKTINPSIVFERWKAIIERHYSLS